MSITFESMTKGEQWHFLTAVRWKDMGCGQEARAMASDIKCPMDERHDAMEAYPNSRCDGYAERYSAALQHVLAAR